MQSVEMSPSVETPVPWYFRGSITPLKRAKDGHELDASPGTAPAVATPPARDLRSDILVPLPSLGNDFCVNQFENPAVAAWGLAQLSREIRRAGKNIDRVEKQRATFQKEREDCLKNEKDCLQKALRAGKRSHVCLKIVEKQSDKIKGWQKVISVCSLKAAALKRRQAPLLFLEGRQVLRQIRLRAFDRRETELEAPLRLRAVR